MKVGIASGYWSQNIGNAFFQIGGAHLIRRSLPGAQVVNVPDAPGNWTLRKKASGNPAGAFDFTGHVAGLDYLVIQGPSLSWFVDKFWNTSIRALRARGTRIVLTGVAFYRFDDDETAAAARFLDEADPVCITTRDSNSFERLRAMGWPEAKLFDGIDSGFWTPYETVPDLAADPFICATFDRYAEPNWTQLRGGDTSGVTLPDGDRIGWTTSDRLDRLASRGKAVAYASALVDRTKKHPARLGDYTIVRPEHRSNPPMHWKAYGSPNGYMADEPWSYLALYKAAAATFSDRVHACVASLAFGRPAMLFNSSPRGSLLDRVAGPAIRSELVQVPAERLEKLRSEQEAFLQGVL